MESLKLMCPFCKNENRSMMEPVTIFIYYCGCCSKTFNVNEVTDDPTRKSEDRSTYLKGKVSEPYRR